MILVTGGTGLVGSHLLLDLVRSGEKVKAIYRNKSKLTKVKKVFSYYVPKKEAEKLFDSIEWVAADILDIPSLNSAFENIISVYHCAAIVSFNSKNAKQLRITNIEGTANIVNSCIKFNVEKLCHISSIASMDLAIGDHQITENFTWYPEKTHSDYAISKYGAEIEVWRGTQEGLNAVIVNPGIIIGPGFWSSGSGRIFEETNKGLRYFLPKTTGFVGVKDVSKASIQLMSSDIKNEQFILVSENLNFKQVLEWISKSINKKPPRKVLKPWLVFLGWIYQSIGSRLWGAEKQLTIDSFKSLFLNRYYSNLKVKNAIGFSFTPIKETIEATGEIFRKENT